MKVVVGDQESINEFINYSETKKLTLGESVLVDILKQMIDGDCKITASKTDHDTKQMWIEITWKQGETE